ncbi:sodium-dependent glucose transporter 1 [Galendromus occidentalis]|uniref:Major facilitator superfamily domain-containing protein 4A n=1 Tax=Galendromus occidentalis TaxID=34638 RepID=A0AAJ6QWK0_9ACAR|nr:sodium-dependent glucose transporter 1 [Galendromus occidentalis]
MIVNLERPGLDYWHSINQIMVIFGAGLSSGIYGPSLIDLAEVYSSTPDGIAVMNSARAVGMFLGSCVGGIFFARMNDQILMIITLLIYAAGTTLIPLLPNITSLYITGFISGTSIGVSHIGSQVRLVKIWPKQSASAIQAFHTAYGVGAMFGPFMGAPFLSERDGDLILRATQLHIPYAAIGVLCVVVVASMIGAYILDPAGIVETKEAKKIEHSASDKRLEIILMTMLFIYLAVCCSGECTFSTLISVYAFGSPALHFSKPEAAYLAGVFWATFTGGRIVSIVIAVFFDVKQLLIISHSLVILASAILIIFNSSTMCAWVGVALMGLGASSLYGAASGLVFQYINVRHLHVSVILAAACLGIAFPSYFVPSIVEVWPMFLQYFTGLGNIIHIIILLAIFWALRGKQVMFSEEAGNQEPKKDSSVA